MRKRDQTRLLLSLRVPKNLAPQVPHPLKQLAHNHRKDSPPLVDAECQKRWIVKFILGHENPRRETTSSRLHARASILYVGSGIHPSRILGDRALRFFETFQTSFGHTHPCIRLIQIWFDYRSVLAVSENEKDVDGVVSDDENVVVNVYHHDHANENVVVNVYHHDQANENVVVNVYHHDHANENVVVNVYHHDQANENVVVNVYHHDHANENVVVNVYHHDHANENVVASVWHRVPENADGVNILKHHD
uniref:Uncharacterized protein n=1 Tax=Peronospora matthiolae TaxID=2874970 RepID=A0AAV1TP67_9STRA